MRKVTYLHPNQQINSTFFMSKPIFKPFANHSIKAIIFDLGGVLININYQTTIDAFIGLGIKNFDQLYSQAQQSNLFDRLEVGEVEPAEFRNTIRSIAKLPLTDTQIDSAWNAMLLDLPPQRVELLLGVRDHYLTLLLSNTNQIHFQQYINRELDVPGGLRLSNLFHREYYSHRVHLRKPNPEVFLHVLAHNGLNPNETLFIDDSIQHVVGAQSVGIHAYHLDVLKGETLEALFDCSWV